MLAFPSSDLDVDVFLEGVAGDGDDVDISRGSFQEPLVELASVGHDGDGFELECRLAELYEEREQLWVEEWFAACEVYLSHPGVFEHLQPPLHLAEVLDVGVPFGVEAEAAFKVAFPCEVIVDGDRGYGRCLGLLGGLWLSDISP